MLPNLLVNYQTVSVWQGAVVRNRGGRNREGPHLASGWEDEKRNYRSSVSQLPWLDSSGGLIIPHAPSFHTLVYETWDDLVNWNFFYFQPFGTVLHVSGWVELF